MRHSWRRRSSRDVRGRERKEEKCKLARLVHIVMGKFRITLEERSGLSATATHTVHLRLLDQLQLVTRLHECET